MNVISKVYIASGLKNGFYTLRVYRECGEFSVDIYLRNLSTDPDKAEVKAKDYFDRVYQGREDAIFEGYADFSLTEWGTALEPWELNAIKCIEGGSWPFGKYQGQEIVKADNNYVFYWAKQEITTATKAPAAMLIEKCRVYAEERGLYAKQAERDAGKEAQAALDTSNSAHVGRTGDRMDFGILTLAYLAGYDSDFGYVTVQTFRNSTGQFIVYNGTLPIWNGERALEIGEQVRIKATVKCHGEFRGIKQTVISRAKVT